MLAAGEGAHEHPQPRLLLSRLLRELRALEGNKGAPQSIITLQMNNALQGERGKRNTNFIHQGRELHWVGGGSCWNRTVTSKAVEISRKGQNTT